MDEMDNQQQRTMENTTAKADGGVMPTMAVAAAAAIAAKGGGRRSSSSLDETPDGSVAKKPRTSSNDAAMALFHDLEKDISNDDDLKSHLRQNWETNPTDIEVREYHLCPMENAYVGLEEKPTEIVRTLFPHSCRDRPPLGMLNACSGSGKSALFQYCEREINAKENGVFALAITFNRMEKDGTILEPVEGLAMRIVERFLITRDVDGSDHQYNFVTFRNLWQRNKYKERMNLVSVVDGIQAFLDGARQSQKILVLVDEPGLAGSSKRRNPEMTVDGTEPILARELVDSTSVLRLHERNVRFIFSSLKPIYDEGELVKKTKTGGKVNWIDVPYFSPTKPMRGAVSARLVGLEERMSTQEYRLASDLIITMASGHWSTLDSIVGEIENNAFDDMLWLKTVYYENVRDVVVQSTHRRSSRISLAYIPKTYKILLMMAIFGVEMDPFKDELSFPDNKREMEYLRGQDIVSLNDMAYDRIVQNRIATSETPASFPPQIPYLSLLDVREWCLGQPEDCFVTAVRDMLYSAGHDPTRSPKEERCPLGIAFERTTTAFIQAKFLSWREMTRVGMFGVRNELSLTEFFVGYKVLWSYDDANDKRMKAPKGPSRRIYIEGSGGFRSKQKQNSPSQLKDESDQDFQKRNLEWYKDALKEFRFDANGPGHLRNGDVICPGAKNQPHSDAIYVVELAQEGGQNGTHGLVFDQYKYSEGTSTTTVSSTDIIKGLRNVVKERGLLYDVEPENREHGNQISALDVKEQDVVYCWSVERKTAEALERPVRDEARRLDFKGTIIITDTNNGSSTFFGQTFKDLALLHRGRYI